MADDFADELAREIPTWVDEGIVDETQASRILDRYEVHSRSSAAGTSWARTLLYATAAVLLGAAGIALVFVGIDPEVVQPWLAGVGAGLLAAGVALHVARPGRDLLVDALLAAALAPLAVATFDPSVTSGRTLAYGLPTAGLSVAYLAWRRQQPFLPTLTVLGFTAAAGGTAFNAIEASGEAAFAWAGAQLALLAGLALGDEMLPDASLATPVGLATVGFAASLVPFLMETVGVESAETLELVLGAVMVVVLGVGLLREHRGLLVGAALALGVDAIAFAFTVGGVWLGTGVLVGLAVVLIWQAERLQALVDAEAHAR